MNKAFTLIELLLYIAFLSFVFIIFNNSIYILINNLSKQDGQKNIQYSILETVDLIQSLKDDNKYIFKSENGIMYLNNIDLFKNKCLDFKKECVNNVCDLIFKYCHGNKNYIFKIKMIY